MCRKETILGIIPAKVPLIFSVRKTDTSVCVCVCVCASNCFIGFCMFPIFRCSTADPTEWHSSHPLPMCTVATAVKWCENIAVVYLNEIQILIPSYLSTGPGASPALYCIGIGHLPTGIKQPEHEAEHSPLMTTTTTNCNWVVTRWQ